MKPLFQDRILTAALSILVYTGAGQVPSVAACTVSAPRPFTLDPQEQKLDRAAPGVPVIKDIWINRGRGPVCNGDRCHSSSCDDLGAIRLTLAPPQDDRTPAAQLGYRVRLLSGQPPHPRLLPQEDVVLDRDRDGRFVLYFHWGDGATDQHPPFSFTLSIQAIDRGGNLGTATTVVVSHSGSGRPPPNPLPPARR